MAQDEAEDFRQEWMDKNVEFRVNDGSGSGTLEKLGCDEKEQGDDQEEDEEEFDMSPWDFV